MSSSKQKMDRVPQGIYKNMNFSRLSTPAGTNKLVVF